MGKKADTNVKVELASKGGEKKRTIDTKPFRRKAAVLQHFGV